MDKKRIAVLYVGGGAIGLIVMVLVLKMIINSQYSSKIPQLSESQTLSQPVKDQISQALTKVQRNPSADNLGMLGLVYHSSANYEQAAQCYELAVRRSNSEWKWNYYLGYLNMEMGNSTAVIENFNRVIESNPNAYHAWYYIGQEYKNLRKNEQAEKSFGEITGIQHSSSAVKETTRLDHFPLSTYAMFQLSRIYVETGRMDLAEKTLKETIQSNRTFGPAYRLLSNVFSMKGDLPLSKHYVARANDLVVFSPPVDTLVDRLVLLSRSELYLLKKIDEGERSTYSEWTLQLVENALQYIPDNKYLISKALNIFLWMNLDKQAIAIIDQHIPYFKESFTEMYNVGISFFLKGLYPQSINYLTRALELEPESGEIQKKLAICFWYEGDKQKSHDLLNALLENNPDNPDLMADVANILFFNFNEIDKASGYLPGLIQLSPSNPKVQKLSAGIAEKNGQVREAIALYESSFRGDPEDITTIRFLGTLLTNQELWGKSIRHYRDALDHHPNDPYFLERLGTLLIACPDTSLRNIIEGRDYSERAFIHMSSRPNTLVYAGRSLAFADATLGNKQYALTTIQETMNIARRQDFSASYQAELSILFQTIKALDD